MRLDGRRESNNVEDRRGMSGGAKAGIGGIGGIILIAIMTFLGGGDLGDVINNVAEQGMTEQVATDGSYTPSAEEEELASFTKKVLASTEDIWTRVFQEQGLGEYRAPTLVLCSGHVNTACGAAQMEQVGPFYCSGDEKLYIDLSFMSSMQQQFGTAGDFAYAYVVAHEVGHHVQHLMGHLHQRNKYFPNETENQTSVRTELQADFLAGVWGYNENKIFSSLEDGDIEEAIAIAAQIGDDRLQKRYQGRVDEDAFTHGSAKQRQKWLYKGLSSGKVSDGNTYAVPYNDL
ncbi:MAG: neutral zinc metallopeptidase [Bacteroidaceae bacterium]|nr:neutral zinc metallopeptidase [Bacteroidaceae bacterium]